MNDTPVSTLVAPALLVLFNNLDLNVNDLEFFMGLLGSSLQYCHKIPNVFE